MRKLFNSLCCLDLRVNWVLDVRRKRKVFAGRLTELGGEGGVRRGGGGTLVSVI